MIRLGSFAFAFHGLALNGYCRGLSGNVKDNIGLYFREGVER